MKELLSKKFWLDVKKTFEEAQQDATPEPQDKTPTPPEDVSASETPPAA
jgi:hypothetical protein